MDRRGEPLVSLDLCGACSGQFDEWMLGPTADESAGKYDFCASNIALDMGIVGSDYSEGHNARHSPAWLRLADLIEPGEPEVKCAAEVKIEGAKLDEAVHRAMAEYTGVDRDELLALADKMAMTPRCDLCPVTVSCTEHAGGCAEALMGHYARRIREACGEAGR